MSTPAPVVGLINDLSPERSGNEEMIRRLRAVPEPNDNAVADTVLPIDQSVTAELPAMGYEVDQDVLSEVDLRNLELARLLLAEIAPGVLAELTAARTRLVPLALRYPMLRASHSEPAHPNLLAVSVIEPIELTELILLEHARQKLRLLAVDAGLAGMPEDLVRSPFRAASCTVWQLLEDSYAFASVAHAFDVLYARFAPSQRGKRRSAVWRTCVDFAISRLRHSDSCHAGARLLVDRLAVGNDRALDRYDEDEPTLPVWAKGVIDDLMASGADGHHGMAWYLMV
jgi:hypothetical protein